MKIKEAKLVVDFKNQQNNNIFKLHFDLLTDRQITHRWASKIKIANRCKHYITDPEKFWGFNVDESTIVDELNYHINVINSYKPIINKNISSVFDQETLNYLHHQFEIFHGTVDSQTHNFWINAPDYVKTSLALLNVHIHKCEDYARSNNQPKVMVNYWTLPKRHTYTTDDYKLFEVGGKFGTVYINYTDVGKNLQSLYTDQVIETGSLQEGTFKPAQFFTADFIIKFYDSDPDTNATFTNNVWGYYLKHSDYFSSLGYKFKDVRLNPGLVPVATINTNLSKKEVLDGVSKHMFVDNVYLQ